MYGNMKKLTNKQAVLLAIVFTAIITIIVLVL